MSDGQRPGVKTSVYLPADVAGDWKASGASITELVRDGLAARAEPLEAMLRRVLPELVRAAVREELAALPAQDRRA
jgi:hypothetical protein